MVRGVHPVHPMRRWWLVTVLLGGAFFIPSVGAQEIAGQWEGVMLSPDGQGVMSLTIARQDHGLTAKYAGLPSFSGSLLSVSVRPGRQPGTITFTAVSRAVSIGSGNNARLRFYLLKEPSKPQLFGFVRLDRDFGKDRDFRVVLEQSPCCDPGCVLRKGCPSE